MLGRQLAFDPSGPQMQTLKGDVVGLYEADYAPMWDLMLADLNVAQLRSPSQAAQDLYIMASPESPMRKLLVADQPAIDIVRSAWRRAGRCLAARRRPRTRMQARTIRELRLQSLFGVAPPAAPAPPQLPGHEIDERYHALRELVGDGPGAPIDLVLRSIGETQQQIAKQAATLVSSGAVASAGGGIDPALALKADAVREPQPFGRWLGEIAAGAIALRSGDPRQQLATIFNASGGPAELCSTVSTAAIHL